jgi:hypothetical protein
VRLIPQFAVLLDKRPIIFTCLTACLIGLLTSCANSPTGKALERSLAADPKLKENPTLFGGSRERNPQNTTSAQLPGDFPAEIPLYPQAKLEKVEPLTVPAAQGQLTSWSSSDPSNVIQSFYQQAFESSNWQIVSKPEAEAGGTLVARRNDLQVTVSIPSGAATSNSSETPSSSQPSASGTSASVTKFDIQYIRNSSEVASQPSGKQEFANPTVSPDVASQSTGTSSGQSQNFTDLDKLPQQLRQYIEDLAALGALTLESSGSKNNPDASGTQFEPNKTITRREFARWLVALIIRFMPTVQGSKFVWRQTRLNRLFRMSPELIRISRAFRLWRRRVDSQFPEWRQYGSSISPRCAVNARKSHFVESASGHPSGFAHHLD